MISAETMRSVKLFKYIARRWMQAFFDTGSVRLGTLHNFSDTVAHGQARGDVMEGKAVIQRVVEGTLALNPQTKEPIVAEILDVRAENVSISNLTLQVGRRSPNAFLFCASYAFSEDLFRRYRVEFGTDACYVVDDLRFFDEISAVIRPLARYVGSFPCQYTPDVIDYQSAHANLAPALMKRESLYGWQREWRALWEPRLPAYMPLSPWDITVPSARSCCRPFAEFDGDAVRWL